MKCFRGYVRRFIFELLEISLINLIFSYTKNKSSTRKSTTRISCSFLLLQKLQSNHICNNYQQISTDGVDRWNLSTVPACYKWWGNRGGTMLFHPNKLSTGFVGVYSNFDSWSAEDCHQIESSDETIPWSCTHMGFQGSSSAIGVWQRSMYLKRTRKLVHRVPLEQDIAKDLIVA